MYRKLGTTIKPGGLSLARDKLHPGTKQIIYITEKKTDVQIFSDLLQWGSVYN